VQEVSLEMLNVAKAEWVPVHEGSMCIVDMRDGDASPGSWSASRTNGRYRNPRDPVGSGGVVAAGDDARGKTEVRHRAETGGRIGS
jgi:hypothetical protein